MSNYFERNPIKNQTIAKCTESIFGATSIGEVMTQAKPLQIRLANNGKNEHCNVARYNHWWNKTASLVCKVKYKGKFELMLITSNN